MILNNDKARVLVIGAKGQDGNIISTKFRDNGIETLGITSRRNSSNKEDWIIPADLSILDNVNEILDSFNPTHIFHMAAVHGSSGNMKKVEEISSRQMHDCHVGIVENLISWAKRNLSVKIIVGLSSQMYSPQKPIDEISEVSPLNPQNYYGQTKAEGYQLLKEARSNFGIKISAGILFNHSSIHSKPEFLFPQIAGQLNNYMRGSQNIIRLRNANSLVSVGDAYEFCEAMIRICTSNVADDFIIANPTYLSISNLIIETSNLLNLKSAPEIVSDSKDPNNSILVGNINKIKQEIGWSPKISPATLLASMTKASHSHDIT